MKKKVFGAVALIAIAVAAGRNYQQSQQESELSDLTLVNVEALASGEITTPTNCPGGLVLCAWITGAPGGSVTYYEK